MSRLKVSPNLDNPDDIYEKLVLLHEGHSQEESLKIWSRLALTLINHIGDPEVIDEAILVARPSPSMGG